MKFHKGKVLYNFKDTFQMDSTLSKVIYSGLVKYKEVINAKEGRKGIPSSISTELIEQGVVSYQEDYQLSEEDWDKCSKHFDYILDEMILAFSDNEPDIMAYDFKHTFVKDSVQDCPVTVSGHMECDNEEESARYDVDMKAYHKRCDKGRDYFSKHFHSLWW